VRPRRSHQRIEFASPTRCGAVTGAGLACQAVANPGELVRNGTVSTRCRRCGRILTCRAAAVSQLIIRTGSTAATALRYDYGKPVIKAFILGVPIPVARSYPGVVGNKPLLLVFCRIPVMSLKYTRASKLYSK